MVLCEQMLPKLLILLKDMVEWFDVTVFLFFVELDQLHRSFVSFPVRGILLDHWQRGIARNHFVCNPEGYLSPLNLLPGRLLPLG